MTYKAKISVSSDSHTKHINAMISACRIFSS